MWLSTVFSLLNTLQPISNWDGLGYCLYSSKKEMGKILAVRNAYRMEQWREIIQDCQKSVLSNRAYCEQHKISEKILLLAAKSAHGGGGAGGATDHGIGARGRSSARRAVHPVSRCGIEAAGRDRH